MDLRLLSPMTQIMNGTSTFIHGYIHTNMHTWIQTALTTCRHSYIGSSHNQTVEGSHPLSDRTKDDKERRMQMDAPSSLVEQQFDMLYQQHVLRLPLYALISVCIHQALSMNSRLQETTNDRHICIPYNKESTIIPHVKAQYLGWLS